MKIVVLSGDSNKGKTTTLNIVYKKLKDKGAFILIPKIQLKDNPKDFECVLLYYGKRIAIYTMGDYSTHLKEAIRRYNYLGVDVLVCACNNDLKEQVGNPFILISKYLYEEESKTNSEDLDAAVNIIKKIKSEIK